MKGISYLTDEVGQKKAVVIDLDILKDRDSLLEDIEDEIAIELRKNEQSFSWEDVRNELINKD